jgi:cell division protein FtsB
MDWKKSRRILVTSVLVLYAAVTVVGLVRSWSLEGNVSDRQVELDRLHQQMLEEQIRTERLEKQIDDLEKRPEFRINTIRQELQMLLPGERILHFG